MPLADRLSQYYADVRALAYAGRLRRGGAVGGNLQIAGAAHDAEHLAEIAIGISRPDGGNFRLAHYDLEWRRRGREKFGGLSRSDIGHQAAEAVDAQDHA